MKLSGSLHRDKHVFFLDRTGHIVDFFDYMTTPTKPFECPTQSVLVIDWCDPLFDGHKIVGSCGTNKVFHHINSTYGVLIYLRHDTRSLDKSGDKRLRQGLHSRGENVNVDLELTIEESPNFSNLTDGTHWECEAPGLKIPILHMPSPQFDLTSPYHAERFQDTIHLLQELHATTFINDRQERTRAKRRLRKLLHFGCDLEKLNGDDFVKANPKFAKRHYVNFCQQCSLKGFGQDLKIGNTLYCQRRRKWFLVDIS